MVDSRLKLNPDSIFLCFLDIASPEDNETPKITKSYPKTFPEQEEIIKRAPEFCYPCSLDNPGVQYSTYVLTDIDSKFRYGFCRYLPHASHCLCIISYLPWFETFYSVLDKISEFKDDRTMLKFLQLLLDQKVPKPGSKLKFKFTSPKNELNLSFDIPDTKKLPSIPSNRNLTEYFAKVDPENMVNLFISMLFERRIIVTSGKLSLLTAVVHGSVSLLYPMQWQHIFVPVLPPSLLPYCCAPMPFLVGIHTSMMKEVRRMPLDEVVIFNADSKEIEIYGDDFKNFPSQVASRLKRKLQRVDRAFQNDYVSKLFLKALADLIGGYRDALKYTETEKGSQVVFDEEMFLETRSGELKDFLTDILALQSFQQFIRGRLDLLNEGTGFADIFEQAVSERNADTASEAKYKQWMEKMRYEVKKGSGAFKKTVGEKYTDLKGIDVKEVKSKMKKKVKDGYKSVKAKATTYTRHTPPDTPPEGKDTTIKRNHSMPSTSKKNVLNNIQKDRKSMYSTLPRRDVPKPSATPPPRPPPPKIRPKSVATVNNALPKSSELPRKNLLSQIKENPMYKESHSATNLRNLTSPTNPSSSLTSSAQSLDISSADSDTSLNSGAYLRNDNTSSIESVGCFTNPGFRDPNGDKYIMADEEDILESSHILQENKTNEKRINFDYEKPEYQDTRRRMSLKRGSPFVNKNRTPPLTRDKTNKNNLEISTTKDENLIDYSNDTMYSQEPAIIIPNSPFYTPSSQDLIGLDVSLFHETMSAVSDDTRNLMIREEESPSVEDNSSFESIDNDSFHSFSNNVYRNQENSKNKYDGDKKLIEYSGDKNLIEYSGDKNLLQNVGDNNLDTSSSKVIQMDPFAMFYDEAKKELTSNNNKT